MRVEELVMSPRIVFADFPIHATHWAGYKFINTEDDVKFKQLTLLQTLKSRCYIETGQYERKQI